MSYPIDKLEKLAIEIQQLLSEYHKSDSKTHSFTVPFEERVEKSFENSANFMGKAGTTILPQVQKIIAVIRSLIEKEDYAFKERIIALLNEMEHFSTNPTNPLGYNELSSLLMKLSGELSVGLIVKPTIFVGYRYIKEDVFLTSKIIKLCELENFNCITGETAQAEDVDDKVKSMIDQSEGVVIIFTKDKELKEGKWTTSSWLIGENAFALGRDKPTIFFFEDVIDESQKKGIHGRDYEFLEFQREKIDEFFLKAIPYLRDFRQKIIDNNKK